MGRPRHPPGRLPRLRAAGPARVFFNGLVRGKGFQMEGAVWFGSAAGFALAMSSTPGPNNAMVAASAANFGLRRSLPHILGVSIGFPVMLVLVALGAAEPLHANPSWQALLRWVGAAWMLWLAWKIGTARPEVPGEAPGEAPRARPMTLVQAALFQWVNPKAWVIAAGAIAAYAGTRASVLADSLLLAVIFFAACIPSLLVWAGMGMGVARLLRTPAGLTWFNRAMAVLLALSVLPMVLGQG